MIARHVVVGPLLALVVTAPAAAASSHTIRVGGGQVLRVGDFRTHGITGSRLGAAIRAFGQPTSMKRYYDGQGCTVKWRRIVGQFANLGGYDACDPAYGAVQTLTLKSPAWRTENGLHVGARTERIAELHRTATLHRDGWWLYEQYSPIGDGGYYPLVKAIVAGGRVRAFKVTIGAAGE